MKKIVLATGNKGKLKEFREMLDGYEVVSPSDLAIDFDVEETGDTFYDNALLKARALYELCGLSTLADDSGLCVNALGGAPGVYSARYSGGGDSANIQKLLNELDGKHDRSAYFMCCIVYYDGNKIVSAEGRTDGVIAFRPMGENGFGYDPIFVSDDLEKSFAVATDVEKNSVSHRSRALRALVKKLRTLG